ncbi:unnamed protein product [Callosobruchus maculatus]|uniref:Uncharacterized protein n=2 Tax=Callosobruchus maculatus TaxID=64391 RepID=A0A653C4S4_CALMS|nr:unnamed protein product [Callosobruchus maculatus]
MFGIVDVAVVTFSTLLLFFWRLLDKRSPPIFGIYQRENGLYWLKVLFMYTALSVRKITNKAKKKNVETLESCQKLSEDGKAIDAVYFNGANGDGDHLVVGMARRKNLLVDGFILLKINSSGLGVLATPKMPSTSLYKEEDNEQHAAEGIRITPIDNMKKYSLKYEGKLKTYGASKEDTLYDVKIDAIWTSDLPYFSFDTDMDPYRLASDMAFEPWSKSYFDTLEKMHQTHYEQFGSLTAKVTINEKEFDIKLDTIRDHTFGVFREWRMFKRYGCHWFTTADGDHFNVSKICCPVAFSRLTAGYMYSKKYQKLYPVTECDLELYQHGSFGNPPEDYAFTVKAGGETYTVQVRAKDTPKFFISKDWEAQIFENLCNFTVNGTKGWGAAEWQYRNIQGKEILK